MLETLSMWTNVQPQLQPHPFRMKISKLRKHLERSAEGWRFSKLVFGGRIVPGTTPNMFFMLSVTSDQR